MEGWDAKKYIISICQDVVLQTTQRGENEQQMKSQLKEVGTPIDKTFNKGSLEIERLTLLRVFKRPVGAQGYNK